MRILVIFAHPSTQSLGYALYDRVIQTLNAQEHEVKALDLYRDGFDPVLSSQEWHSYLGQTDQNIANVQPHVEALLWAEGLVFVFPTFFYGVPAILKGWFERTWLPGVAFETAAAKKSRPNGKLQHIKLITVITTSGSPKWWIWLIRDPVKSFFKRGIRPLFAKRCKYIWCQLYDMNHVSRDEGNRFLNVVEQRLRRI